MPVTVAAGCPGRETAARLALAGPPKHALPGQSVRHTGRVIDGELGAFLRSRREQISPAQVGLPAGSRRRTPGLRRAELATLAGVSVDYLIRLEQGRDLHPSTQVLTALAQALRLGEADLAHLQQLATVSQGTGLCAGARPAAARAVRPQVRAMLDRLDPTPAYVVNHLTDLLAWNDSYDRLTRPLGVLDGDPPNLLTYALTDPRAHQAYQDWDDVADELVSHLHQLRRGDPAADQLADQLTDRAGAAFTGRWQQRPLAGRRTGVTGLAHPSVGMLRLSFEALELSDRDYQQLVVYLPADTVSAAGLDRLAGRHPGALRSITGA